MVGNSFYTITGTYTEDGFTISPITGSLFRFGTLESRYPGSTALANTINGGTISLSQLGSGPFTLSSIDLTDTEGNSNVTVSFAGLRTDGSTVNQSFTTDAVLGLETFNFSNFTNLVSVDWTQDAPFHQFDNINVTPGATASTAIPEPFTILGTITAAGFAAVFKRKLAKDLKDSQDIEVTHFDREQ